MVRGPGSLESLPHPFDPLLNHASLPLTIANRTPLTVVARPPRSLAASTPSRRPRRSLSSGPRVQRLEPVAMQAPPCAIIAGTRWPGSAVAWCRHRVSIPPWRTSGFCTSSGAAWRVPERWVLLGLIESARRESIPFGRCCDEKCCHIYRQGADI